MDTLFVDSVPVWLTYSNHLDNDYDEIFTQSCILVGDLWLLVQDVNSMLSDLTYAVSLYACTEAHSQRPWLLGFIVMVN